MTATAVRPAEPPPIAQGLPAWVYNHPEMTRLEIERILKPSWQIVCHTSQIPSAGDYITFELGADSVIVLRAPDGGIRALRNVCRHRGTRLLEGSGRCQGRITCPYHGWTYRYDGSLLATPARDSFPGLNLRDYSLAAVHVELALGFVFVCLAAKAPPPPSQMWAPIIEELAPYRLEELVPTQPMYVEEWNVDWKIAMDNYLESYHVPIGHPGLSRMMTPDYEDQRGIAGIARGISWLPNLGLDVMPEQMDFFQVLPRRPGKALIRGAAFGLPDARREMRLVRWLGNRINMQVNREDRHLCERLQRGLADSAYLPGPLSSLETWMLEFHDLLRERIPEAHDPEPPARFA